jgi:uncharacterized protein
MYYQRFGKTNLNLSVFSLGTMRCLSSPENAKNTIYQAVELGINHIETARGYGQSEVFLGKALKSSLSIPREQLIITTKIPPVADAQIMEQYIQESLQRLQLDYIDCLAIHGINTPEHLELIQKNNGCMQAVWKAQNQGLIRYIGFSTHGEQSVIIKAIETGFFEFINLHYYYFFQRHEPIIELAHKKDLGILIISPADKGGQLYTPPQLLQELCYPLSPLELNYRFLLSDPRITTLTVGAAHPEELKLPLESADKNQELTTEEIEIFQRLETHLKTTLKTDLCSQCYDCLPCPENINIPEVLRLRNLSRGYNMTDYGKYRYRMFENAGHWFWGKKGNRCTDCGECLPRCPEKLEIPLLLRDTHEMLNGTERRRLWEEKNN